MFDEAALPLPGDHDDLLGGFEQDAMLDLLRTLEPLDPALLQHSTGNAAAQTSSREGSAEGQTFAHDQQQTDRKAQVKELNKRAQKRHREKQKV